MKDSVQLGLRLGKLAAYTDLEDDVKIAEGDIAGYCKLMSSRLFDQYCSNSGDKSEFQHAYYIGYTKPETAESCACCAPGGVHEGSKCRVDERECVCHMSPEVK